jgi:hypothetical protein
MLFLAFVYAQIPRTTLKIRHLFNVYAKNGIFIAAYLLKHFINFMENTLNGVSQNFSSHFSLLCFWDRKIEENIQMQKV